MSYRQVDFEGITDGQFDLEWNYSINSDWYWSKFNTNFFDINKYHVMSKEIKKNILVHFLQQYLLFFQWWKSIFIAEFL